MGRILLQAALIAAIALVLILARQARALRGELTQAEERAAWPHAGFVVPPVPSTTLAGESVVLGHPAAGRHQLLLVFNTTCGFCRETLPAWESLAARLSGAGTLGDVEVVGLSLHPEQETRAYAREHGLSFPIVAAPSKRLEALYRAQRVPQTLVITDSGDVRFARIGSFSEDAPVVDSILVVLDMPPLVVRSREP